MKKARIAVLVSGGGTNLQALIDAGVAGLLPHGELALVVSSNPDAYALRRAEAAGINHVAIGRSVCPTDEEFETALEAALRNAGIDMIVLAGFLRILSARFVGAWENRIINVHPSLIPAFCGKGFYGLRVHEAALARGVKLTGATVHIVDSVPDGGRILLQKAVEVLEGDTPETLQKRVMEQAEWKLLPEAAELVAEMICERL